MYIHGCLLKNKSVLVTSFSGSFVQLAHVSISSACKIVEIHVQEEVATFLQFFPN